RKEEKKNTKEENTKEESTKEADTKDMDPEKTSSMGLMAPFRIPSLTFRAPSILPQTCIRSLASNRFGLPDLLELLVLFFMVNSSLKLLLNHRLHLLLIRHRLHLLLHLGHQRLVEVTFKTAEAEVAHPPAWKDPTMETLLPVPIPMRDNM
ncbi:hypothetical protein AAVH_33975, partial [Aphelenchoides avenae]